jgi:pre-mRNA-splicing factor ATP-dependent RNA helicase DHX15/PRP43
MSIGILDPDGTNPNPLTGEAYSEKYRELSAKWREFPAYQKVNEILKAIKDNNVILVTSGTGSGKTVLIPKFCLHALNYDAKIGITLPKKIITKSAAEFAAATLDVKLGDVVGYQYRGSDRKHRSSKNKLLYATDGTIMARLLSDPLLKDFDAVIIDEAHERSVRIDFLLYLLKDVIKNRPEFKLIIMSATINVDIFKKYYESMAFVHIDIGGRTNYEIESIFLKNS